MKSDFRPDQRMSTDVAIDPHFVIATIFEQSVALSLDSCLRCRRILKASLDARIR